MIAILTAEDNFAGRSTTTFGIAERVTLSFTSNPVRTAAQLGGLRWTIESGGGAFATAPGVDGRGTYVAPASPGSVTLRLQHVLVPLRFGPTRTITVVAPDDAVMSQWPGTNVWHRQHQFSVGFKGQIHLRPKTVSFRNIRFREGRATAVATGWLAPVNGRVHPVGGAVGVDSGNSVTGAPVLGRDTVQTRLRPPYQPFAAGDFDWPIPWEYLVGTGAAVQITIAHHHSTSDGAGRATIEKKGAGPFAKNLADPTSAYGIDGH